MVEHDRRPGLTPLSLLFVILIAYVVFKIQLVLILTLLALIFATAIEGPLRRLEVRRIPRGVGILMIYVGIIGAIALMVVGIVPVVSDEASQFREELPADIRSLQREWNQSSNPILSGTGADLLGRAAEAIEEPPAPEQETTINVATTIGGAIVGVLTVFAIAFYYLMEKSLLRRLVIQELRPEAQVRVNRLWDESERKVGDWLRGQLTLCLIIGVTATIGYGIMGIQFWPLLGLWAGITEIIPILGPWIGGVPAVLVALTMGWREAMLVTGFIVILQFLENMDLVPRVMRGAVGLTPLTVFVAILAGTQFYGPIGALLAIPIAALVQILITDYLDRRRGAHRPGGALNLPGWRWMRGPLGTAEHGVPPQHYPVEASEIRYPAPPPDIDQSSASFTPVTPPSPAGAPGWTTELLNRAAKRLAGGTGTSPEKDETPPSAQTS
jgi:predicted PurR-regulated permease PerM